MINKVKNVFGGDTIYQNGQLMGTSSPNIFGGETFFDATGSIVGNTSENVLGGVNMTDSHGGLQGYTTDNIMGGNNIFDGTGTFTGYTTEFGDMGTLFSSSGGIEAIVSGGGAEMFGSLDLDPEALMETMSTIADIV